MAEGQTQKAIARLRFFLAQVQARERELRDQERQFQAQLKRLPTQIIYGPTGVDSALAVMAEVEERLLHVQATLRHLDTIRRRAQQEVEALLLTVQVEEAKGLLASLQARVLAGEEPDGATADEMRRLQAVIDEYSKRAGQIITDAGTEQRS